MLMRIAMVILALTLGVMNSCTTRYTASQPTYVEAQRPPQPSNVHVWVGSGWVWHSQSRSYRQRHWHWAMPRRGRNYHQGHWKKTRRGSVWVNGHW